MIAAFPSLNGLRPNPNWAKLPLFDRKGWKRIPFGTFADSINERVEPSDAAEEIYVGLEHLDPQSLHIRRWGKGSDVIGTKLRFRKGDIIFGRRRAYQRKLAIAEFDGICSAHAMVVRAKPELVLPEFLPFLMTSDKFMNRAVEISVGSLSPTINWTTLKLEEFDLPPLDQQHRIAEILWAVDGCKVQKKSLYDWLKVSRKAKLNIACSSNSEIMRLGDVVVYASDGPFGSKLKTEHYVNSGMRVIRLQNIGDGHFEDADKAYISTDYFEELRRYAVFAGDVIVAGLGDETHPVGRAALIPETLGAAINKADCFCIRADTRKVLNAYLVHFLNSAPGIEQLRARAQGTTRMRINVGNIKTVLVPVPSVEQQKRMTEDLKRMEIELVQVQQSILDTDSLLTSLIILVFEDGR